MEFGNPPYVKWRISEALQHIVAVSPDSKFLLIDSPPRILSYTGEVIWNLPSLLDSGPIDGSFTADSSRAVIFPALNISSPEVSIDSKGRQHSTYFPLKQQSTSFHVVCMDSGKQSTYPLVQE